MLCVAGVLVVASAWAQDADRVVTLAAAAGVQRSGLLDAIHPDFEARTGVKIKVIARNADAALQLAREGIVDAVLVDAPDEEARFVSEGWGVRRTAVMSDDLVIVGPSADPAGIKGMRDAAGALARIGAAAAPFVSRGDNSATHLREQALWKAARTPVSETELVIPGQGGESRFKAVVPEGAWYQSVGGDAEKAVGSATGKRAYTVIDRATYCACALGDTPRTDLAILAEGDPALRNEYHVIAVSDGRQPAVNRKDANAYIDWITSPETQQHIGAFKISGKPIYQPGK